MSDKPATGMDNEAVSKPGVTVVDPSYLAKQMETATARADWPAVARLVDELTAVNAAIQREKDRTAPAAATPGRRVFVQG